MSAGKPTNIRQCRLVTHPLVQKFGGGAPSFAAEGDEEREGKDNNKGRLSPLQIHPKFLNSKLSKIFATITLWFDHLDLWNLGILGVAITYLGRIVSGQFFRDWVPSNRSSGTNFKFRRVYAYAICTILGAPGTNFKFRV